MSIMSFVRGGAVSAFTLAILLLLTLAPAARGSNVDRIFVFGDSLSDTGNAALAPGGIPYPSATTRFTNDDGPIWVEVLADRLGLARPGAAFDPFNPGTGYAVGGAGTGSGLTPIFNSPGLQDQVGAFQLGVLGGAITPQATDLFTVWGGANDFFLLGSTDPTASVANVMTAVQNLAATGAQQILVLNMPPLGFTPGTLATGDPLAVAGANAWAAGYNLMLDAQLDAFEAGFGGTLVRFDVAALFGAAIADPAAFGFTNVTEGAFNVMADPSTYLFWDDIHPTARTHAALGLAIAQIYMPEPTTAAVFAIAAATLAARRPTRRMDASAA